jgi:hypothetical protein
MINNPHRIIVKKEWRENNPEKIALYTINHRAKMILEDPEGYHKHQAENQKKYYDEHPEKRELANQLKKNES